MFQRLQTRDCFAAVVSSDGFEVRLEMPLKEGFVVYKESGNLLGLGAYYPDLSREAYESELPVLNIEVENHLRWNKGHAGMELSPEEKKRVLANISLAFEFLKQPVRFIDLK